MKKMIGFAFVCLFVSSSLATYTYVVDSYGPSKHLENDESILILDKGGMDSLYLTDFCTAKIEGTSTLGSGTGGIWTLSLSGNSSLDFFEGQAYEIAIHNDATAVLRGGLIQQIWSQQLAWQHEGDPPVLVPNPHITIVYSGDLPTYNETTNILTGLWENGNSFSIHLSDIPEGSGYSPAIENIQFIPEPGTMALLGIGGLLIRRKK